MIYGVMINVATFDILPTDDIYPHIFTGLPEQDPLSSKFERLEYGSNFSVMNMGTLLIFFFWYLMLLAIYPFISFFASELKCAANL